MDGYNDFNNIKQVYCSLDDELSKKIFIYRLIYDIEPSLENAYKFLSIADLYYNERLKRLKSIAYSNKKIYLYGGGYYGMEFYNLLRTINNNINICGIFDKNYNIYNTLYDSINLKLNEPIGISYCDKILNKDEYNIPLFAPPTKQWVCDNQLEDYIIFISTKNYIDDIISNLQNIGIDDKNIVVLYDHEDKKYNNQYFDFKKYYKPNGIFIDAGCFDGQTSIQFAKWCNNKYSKIYAFEPEENNLEKCKYNLSNLKNIRLINAALGACIGTSYFCSDNQSSSYISENGETKIDITTIDKTVKSEKVSFIKMDIEGSELDALKGSKNTIKRDKPLCAISVYHKAGDVLTIGKYLKSLVPEYRFKIRHYNMNMAETILYAYI